MPFEFFAETSQSSQTDVLAAQDWSAASGNVQAATEASTYLSMLKKGDSATVTGLAAVDGPEQLAIKIRLLELGFAAGEKLKVVAESFPRRDPMAVRIGNTVFALRRAEAAMIQVVLS